VSKLYLSFGLVDLARSFPPPHQNSALYYVADLRR
jgi:hypothetical protein